MRKKNRTLMTIVLIFSILFGMIGGTSVYAAQSELTAEQRNAIAMLNYITVLTQDINSSKNSRVYMEEAYSTLINNTYPNAVDSRTLDQLTGLLDTMENYRMINVKRERLQYIYEQSKAQAIRAAMPNPIGGLIGSVGEFSPQKLILSIVYMAVDSVSSYTAYTASAEQNFLKDGWALDDEESKVLHESRKGTFSYMVKMVNDYDLPGDLTLTEGTVNEFVKYKNSENIVSRIRFLESNQKTYQSYGGYWLALAESYYKNGDYQKCIDAVDTYEKMGTRIFRYDYELAKVLPLAIAAAKEIYSKDNYASYASEKAQTIVDNTDHDSWALRYFAATTLVDLYAETRTESYLKKAYDITFDNVNYLVAEQQALNSAYLSDVKEQTVPKTEKDKAKKKEIENYNKMLKETRKTEMPPIYEPLMLNCDLLYAIADEMKIPDAEKTKIDRLLHPTDNRLFLTETVDEQYWFNPKSTVNAENMTVDFNGKELSIPAEYLTKDAVITVTVMEPDNKEPVVLTNWVIDKVDRGKEKDISKFVAEYTSKDAKKYSWIPDSKVTIEIKPKTDMDKVYIIDYKTVANKNAWYDHAKVWEGKVKFERVD